MNRLLYATGIFALLTQLSCSATRALPDDALLFTGAKIEYQGAQPDVPERRLITEIRQVPNSRFLGWPIELNIFNLFRNKERGLGKWLRDKLGEAPVILDEGESKISSLAITKALQDEGYLQAVVDYDTIVSKRKAKVIYKVRAAERYQLTGVDWPADTTALGQFVQRERRSTALLPNQPYRTDLLRNERQRLMARGLEQGFFGLNKEVFYFFLDTLAGDHEVHAFVQLAEDQAEQPFQRHYIGNTTVYATYLLDTPVDAIVNDTLTDGHITCIQTASFMRPDRLSTAILQRDGDLFQQSLQQKSINRLLGLGPFKFVNLEYRLRQVQDSLLLDRIFFMTPGPTQDFSAELEASTLSTASSSLDFGLNLNYTHRNIFGGAEQFRVQFSGGAATQLGSEVDFINSINLSLEGRLSMPGLLVPFRLGQQERAWQSRTNVLVSGEFQRRTNFFTLASVNGQFGYEWQPGPLQRFQFFPAQFTLVNLLNSTEAFDTRLNENPRLRASFSNYLILSSSFQFEYSEEKPNKREDFLALRAAIEPAGNLAQGLFSLFGAGQPGRNELLNVPFAQFFRFESELRYHWYQRRTALATRFSFGVALPYGNSNAVPYVRQFFVGGSNSLRAWQIRALGPGANEVEASDAEVFQDQTGDIKLEANVEYRFPIFSYLKGAAFVDAGNIWLTNQGDTQAPETIFRFDDFYNQIAVGSGLGLRLDVTFFVLRLDVAFPIRKPYNPRGSRWTFNDLEFGNPTWRQENLVYNLALGYPF
jgi:outer membrane protein insertion porin family